MWQLLPNSLSLARILISPSLVVIYSRQNPANFSIALGLILFALASDILDGLIARKWGLASKTGYVLDGLADRATYASLILILVRRHELELAIAWLVLFREIAIYAERLTRSEWFERNEVRFVSLWHAAGIRLWFGSYLLADGLNLYLGLDLYSNRAFIFVQSSLILFTLGISYYAIYWGLRNNRLILKERNKAVHIN